MPCRVESPGAKPQPILLPRPRVLSVEWAQRTSCSGCRCFPCPFTPGVGAPSCGASSSPPSDCSRSFGDAPALGLQQSPLPWELISLRRIGSRLRLHLPIPRLHWPALPATPSPGFVLLTLSGFIVAQLSGAIAATLLFRWVGNATRF